MMNVARWQYISLLILSALSASLITYLILARYYAEPGFHELTVAQQNAYLDNLFEDYYTRDLPESLELYEEMATRDEEWGTSNPNWLELIADIQESIATYNAEHPRKKDADELLPEF